MTAPARPLQPPTVVSIASRARAACVRMDAESAIEEALRRHTHTGWTATVDIMRALDAAGLAVVRKGGAA